MMQAQKRNRGRRISRRSRRILQRLAPRGKHSQALTVGRRFGIEEPSGNRIEEPRNHCVANGPREFEITEVRRSFIGVEASQRSSSIVIKQTANRPMFSLG